MSSPPPLPGAARSAAAVNEDIRALVTACGGWLYGETRQRYELLRDEWTVAVARERALGDVVTAA
ncbi:hypothetical protein ACIHCX_03650 [Streptomyces sp. NPDC052043]|uniref:hypothetical protein n=1 Tax=Streptomyces sp. NPDC052043 TaxID=3365684 RepID=UPI0037D093DB